MLVDHSEVEQALIYKNNVSNGAVEGELIAQQHQLWETLTILGVSMTSWMKVVAVSRVSLRVGLLGSKNRIKTIGPFVIVGPPTQASEPAAKIRPRCRLLRVVGVVNWEILCASWALGCSIPEEHWAVNESRLCCFLFWIAAFILKFVHVPSNVFIFVGKLRKARGLRRYLRCMHWAIVKCCVISVEAIRFLLTTRMIAVSLYELQDCRQTGILVDDFQSDPPRS